MKDRIITELLKLNIKSKEELMAIKRRLAKKYGIGIISNSDILKNIKPKNLTVLRKILRKRAVRTLSGVAPVAVLVKPYPCPGKCAYCPTEKDVPQSYLSNEPAVMRAIGCDYDPYKQVQYRLKALEANGHEPNKIELIVIGGTWSVLPEKYKFWYIKECFRAANDFNKKFSIFNFSAKGGSASGGQFSNNLQINKFKKQLLREQKNNETAEYKIIGLTLETRPDYINEKELLEMRELGCTRVELGVQAVDDKILAKNLRGHGVKEIAEATKLLKNFGFKVTYHIMPGLPSSSPKKDLEMFKNLFSDERFQPDQLKFYPTVVTRGSLLYKWWKAGKYKPYSDKVLKKLVVECKKAVPEYVRIVRLIRDIPAESIEAGSKITNLRQVLAENGVKCKCIRCREAKELRITNYELRIIKYRASGGEEYFIQAESRDGKTLYGFCRLRLPSWNIESKTWNKNFVLDNLALIRELHVYGELVPVGASTSSTRGRRVQHEGLGKKLMAEAENIAKKNDYKKIAVIAGVGARGYYKKLGYRQKNTYMIKNL